MITNLQLENFKTLKSVNVPLRPLSLLTGLNGSGKSSFIQALLILRQSVQDGTLSKRYLRLNGSLVEIGTGKDVLYQFAPNEELKFGLTFSDSVNFIWDVISESEQDYLEPIPKNLEASDKDIYIPLENQSLFNDNFQYLNAEHLPPQKSYSKSPSLVKRNQVGTKGEFAAHFLSAYGNRMEIPFENLHHEKAKTRVLLQEAEAWLGEISPNIRLQIIEGINNQLYLRYPYLTKGDTTQPFDPTNAGFGISYVLPVIVSLLSAKKDRLIILENPEAHLHPKGQSRMGRLMALAAQNDVQIIVETHSDHILNGIRVAVKKGEVDPEKVGIYYFNRPFEEREHRAEIIMPKIDQNGRIDQWPEGFFDEWENMLDDLII